MNQREKHRYQVLCQCYLQECQILFGNLKSAVTLEGREEAVLNLVNRSACLQSAVSELAELICGDDPDYKGR